MNFGGLVVAQDLATAVCGVFNAGYFAAYWWRRNGRSGRRFAAVALVLVSAAAVSGAAFSQGLFWSQDEAASGLAPSLWAVARLPAFAATAFISLLVLRRMRG